MRERLLACAACAACATGAARPATEPTAGFDCRARRARYVVSPHIGGRELGVEVACAPRGPELRRWRVDREGTRSEDARPMTTGELDQLWVELDATGWANLHDCPGRPAVAPTRRGPAAPPTPVFRFAIEDDRARAAFLCRGTGLPYPYSSIVDALDLAAQQGRHQLGGDEPPATPRGARP